VPLRTRPVVQDVAEVDTGLAVLVIQLEGAPKRRHGLVVLAHPVMRVAEARDRFRGVRHLLRGDGEELAGRLNEPLAE